MFEYIAVAFGHVAAVVENRVVRVIALAGFGGFYIILVQTVLRALRAMFGLIGIKTVLLHIVQAVGAAAITLENDIQENPVSIREKPDCLTDLITKIWQIWAVETHRHKASLMDRSAPSGICSFIGEFSPFRMLITGYTVDTCRKVDRNIDPYLFAGIKLRSEQVKVQIRVNLSNVSWMV